MMNESRLAAHQPIVKNFEFLYDMNNRQLVSVGTDNGTKKVLQNAVNNTIYVFTPRGFTINTKYDVLQRPTDVYVTGNDLNNNLVERVVYGESITNPEEYNLRGQPLRHYDQAGLREFLIYDIESHNIQLRTTLRIEYKKEVNWNNGEILDTQIYNSQSSYDALNRIITRNQSDETVQQYTYYQYGPLKSAAAKKLSNFSAKIRGSLSNSSNRIMSGFSSSRTCNIRFVVLVVSK